MLKKICAALSLLSMTALPASAVVIDINYSATITNVYGEFIGYNIGDNVEGSIKLDLASSPGDQTPWSHHSSSYRPLPGKSNLVSGYVPENTGTPWDRIEIYDDSYNDNLTFFGDSLEFIDGYQNIFSDGISNSSVSIQIWLAFNNPNVVTSDDINNITNFNLDDLLAPLAFGSFVNSTFILLSPSDYTLESGVATFKFTSLDAKVSRVNEPLSMGIFTLAFFSLFAHRKFKRK